MICTLVNIPNFHYVAPTDPVCPDDITAGIDIGGADPNITWTDPTNNDTGLYPLVPDVPSGSAFSSGVNTVTVSRQDFPSFNCTFTVTVIRELLYVYL